MKTDTPRHRSGRFLSLLSQPVRMGLGALAAVFLTAAPAKLQAATCDGTFTLNESANSWTSSGYNIIRYSPDGTKVAVTGGSNATFGGAGWRTLVLDVPGLTRNTTLSQAYSNNTLEWTPSGGILMEDTNFNLRYTSPGGTSTLIKGAASNVTVLDMYPVKGTTKTLVLYSYGSARQVYVFDDANTASPTLTQIKGFGTAGATLIYDIDPVIVGTSTRIYLSRSENTNLSSTIKAYDYSGNLVTSGWTDVKLDYESTFNKGDGFVIDMNIRPTDGLIFSRLHSRGFGSSGAWFPMSNLVIFDQNGNVAPSTAFNRDDLSVLSSSFSADPRITFDPLGNIYGNLSRANLAANQVEDNSVAPWPAGVIKFDPKGNIDFGFMREVVRSYGNASGAMANSFDVNQSTGMIGIVNHNSQSFNWATDPAHRRHDIEQVEHWSSNTKYGYVQFWFNSGLLIRPNMDSATAATLAAENCGFQPVVTVSTSTDGAATMDCAKTAFMPAPVQGTAQQLSVLVTMNVTQAGTFNPVTITGSGLSVPSNFTITTTSTGVQQFVVPVNYSGATLASFDLTVGSAGTCTGNLASTPTNNTKEAQIKIWTVDNCTYKLAGPALK